MNVRTLNILSALKSQAAIEWFVFVPYAIAMIVCRPGKCSTQTGVLLMLYSVLSLGIALMNANDSTGTSTPLLGSTGGIAAGILFAMAARASFLQLFTLLSIYIAGFGFGVIVFHTACSREGVAHRCTSFVLAGIAAGIVYAVLT